MARIRSIHPSLFTDEQFAGLSDAAQIFYLGLLTEADDQGIFEWKPVTLRMRLRPTKDGAADALLSEIEAADKIASYEIDGRKYGAIRNFRKFQRPKSPNAIHPTTQHWRIYVGLEKRTSEPPADKRPPFPQKGEIAPQMEEEGGRREEGDSYPPETTVVSAPARKRKLTSPSLPLDSDGSSAEGDADGIQQQRAQLQAKKHQQRTSTINADWRPTVELIEYARAQGCVDPDDTFERFRLHHASKGTRHVDWTLAAQLWCRNEKNFRRNSDTTGGSKPLKFN